MCLDETVEKLYLASPLQFLLSLLLRSCQQLALADLLRTTKSQHVQQLVPCVPFPNTQKHEACKSVRYPEALGN